MPRVRESESAITPASRRHRAWPAGVGALAVGTAALLLVAGPGQPDVDRVWSTFAVEAPPTRDTRVSPPTSRHESSSFDFRVEVARENTESWAALGSAAHPGDQMRFTIYPRTVGHLIVLGLGPDGATYPCHPLEGGRSASVEMSSTALSLEGAVVVGEALGDDLIVAVFCPESFDYESVATGLSGLEDAPQKLRDGCEQKIVRFETRAPGSDQEGLDVAEGMDPLGRVGGENYLGGPLDAPSGETGENLPEVIPQ